MPTPRRLVVDSDQPGFYHCISRCVRRAFLCGDDYDHRKTWIQGRLRELADIFAIEVAGYAVMSNHLHVVLWTGPDRAAAWSRTEVASRWVRLFPKSTGVVEPDVEQTTRRAVRRIAADAKLVKLYRNRLSDLSWFLRCLCEPIARTANQEDDCTGRFWEGRFKCHALLDEAAVLACLVYVDLNLVRARLAPTPERSEHTSVKDRIDARRLARQGAGRRKRQRRSRQAAILFPHLPAGRVPRHAEDGMWLTPIQDRADAAARGRKRRRGLFDMTLEHYLELVDATGRFIRSGKGGAIPHHLQPILRRLDLDPRRWAATMGQVTRMFGTAIGSASARAREAVRRGRERVVGALDVYSEPAVG